MWRPLRIIFPARGEVEYAQPLVYETWLVREILRITQNLPYRLRTIDGEGLEVLLLYSHLKMKWVDGWHSFKARRTANYFFSGLEPVYSV